MNDPISLLLLFIFLAILVGVIVWPRRGAVARLGRLKQDKKRILAEDCLKYLHDAEYRQKERRIFQIGKAFSLSSEETMNLLNGLKTAGLVHIDKDVIHLTESGRMHALQIVRIHRLLEQYMAKETSLQEREWHTTAEEQEHTLTAQEADALAAQLGNPLFDPHGDPIPTAEGDMPDLFGVPLRQVPVGDSAKVVHIEDEPPDVYASIIALGIQPGTMVKCVADRKSVV